MGTKIIKIFKSKGIQLVARLALGSIFIYASIDKIAFPAEFAKIVRSYNILPDFFIGTASFFLPWIELILGILLVIGLFTHESAIVLSSLLIIFIIAIAMRSLNGEIENCGCFLFSSKSTNPNVILLILRDLLFLLFGLVTILSSRLKA